MDNKKIILVGATGILGRTFSTALAEEGADLILLDHPETDVLEFSNSLSVEGIEVDLGNETNVIEAIKMAYQKLGKFDGVVNNAAVTGENLLKQGESFKPFENYPTDLWQYTLNINLTGTFLVCREAGKRMTEKGGSIINISSIYGINGPDHKIYLDQDFKSLSGYAASKAGIIGLTQWLATWWAENNIRVNCITPGGIYNNHNEKFLKAYSARTPMGRMADRKELIGMLLYLLSDLSSYCTGQNYIVDGGYSAW